MCTKRSLLCLTPTQPCEAIYPALESAGWDIQIAHDNEEARELITSKQIKVALTPLEAVLQINPAMEEEERENTLPLSQYTEWVALVQPHLKANHWNESLAKYFYDYHTLPADIGRLLNTLGHAHGMATLMGTNESITALSKSSEDEMVGISTAMQVVFRNIRKVSGVDAPVLITGESGTGKELAASAIHERSRREGAPFVAVNCGALPANLIQSELFGHEKGAFTDAHERKIGLIESAAGGTLFLDEIGDLPMELQTNLLRFLQEGTLVRVGGRQSIPIDVRIISATHVNIEKAIDAKCFREDLYYRLNVLNLHLPPLRERTEDIDIIAKYYFQKFSTDATARLKGFSQTALNAMVTHPWPGNVRELINRVRRAMVMSDGRLITSRDLGFGSRETERIGISLKEARMRAEAETIRDNLKIADNNISMAARSLGISRVNLYRLMDKLHIYV